MVGVIWLLFGVATTVRDNFLTPEEQQQFATLRLLPHWHWYVWVIGILALFLLMGFEGSLHVTNKLNKDLDAATSELVLFRNPPWHDSEGLLATVGFDYLPGSPLENGWTKAYKKDGQASFDSDTDIDGSLRMKITQSEFAMDHPVPAAAVLANRFIYTAKYDTTVETMIFLRLWVSTRDEKDRKNVWLKFYLGQKGAKQTPGFWHDPNNDLPEQTIYWPARVSKGAMEFEISLDEAVKIALGSQGWVYRSAMKMRLRGNLSISPIKFVA